MAENEAEGPVCSTRCYTFSDNTHSAQMLSEINALRQNALFCDVTIRVEETDFLCHRLVLASCSAYFRAMFSSNMAESRQETVAISNMEASVMKLIVDFAYTAQVLITEDNVQSLLSAANLLEVITVRDACCRYLCKNMDETNCIGIYSFAETHSCTELQLGAKDFILKHFARVSQQEEILGLSQGELIEIISDDKLIVGSEKTVFTAILRWYHHCEDSRRLEFVEVFEHVRLALLSPSSLDCIQQEDVIQASDRCMQLVREARAYQLSKNHSLLSSLAQPRNDLGSLCQFEASDIVDMDYLPTGHIIAMSCVAGDSVKVYEENGQEVDHPLVSLCNYTGHAMGVSVNAASSSLAVIENFQDSSGRLHIYVVDDTWHHQVYDLCKNPIYISYVMDDHIIVVDYDDTIHKYTNNGILVWEKNTSNLNIMSVAMDGLGRILVCYSDHVAVHDSDCNELFSFPESADKKLELRALCVDSRNNILVADYGSEAVLLYNGEGQFLRQLLKLDREPMCMSLYGDHHLAVCMGDDMLYVYHVSHLLSRQ